jgi:hypothetical protein
MAPTTERQIYDPNQLVRDVEGLLRAYGLNPHVAEGKAGEALGGAGMLLRAMGITPAMHATDSYERSMNKLWGEDHG